MEPAPPFSDQGNEATE